MAAASPFPSSPSEIASVFDSVSKLEKFETEAFRRLERELFALLDFYEATGKEIFSDRPSTLRADDSYSMTAILKMPAVTETAKVSSASNAHHVKLSPEASRFLKVLWARIFPAEIFDWTEWTSLAPLSVFHRVKALAVGSADDERRRLFRETLKAVHASYSPGNLRTQVTQFQRYVNDLQDNLAEKCPMMVQTMLEYLIRHGHPSMDAHLVNTSVDPSDASFNLDSLVASFKRACPPSVKGPVKALDTGVVSTSGASSAKKQSGTQGSGSGRGDDSAARNSSAKAKKKISQQFVRDGTYDPANAGQCLFCRRAHAVGSCRALNWCKQVFAHHPDAALLALPAGCTLRLADGKEYTKPSNYSESPHVRDTGVTIDADSRRSSSIVAEEWNEAAAAAAAPEKGELVRFVCDTGTDMHMTSHAEWFHSMEPASMTITFGGKESSAQAVGIGTIKMRVEQHSSASDALVTLTNVLYVPDLVDDLLSPKAAYASGALHVGPPGESYLTVGDNHLLCLDYDERRDLWLCGSIALALESPPDFAVRARVAREHSLTPQEFHRAFGHRADVVASAAAIENVSLTEPDEDDSLASSGDSCSHEFDVKSCETCLRTQMRRKSFPKKAKHPARATNDCWVIDNVPQPIPGVHGETNILLVLDEFSRYPLAFLPTFSREASELVPIIERLVRRFGAPIVLRSDGEFVASNLYQDLCKQHGINTESTVPYSAQQNGIAEARQAGFMAKTRALLSESRLPRSYWPWAAPHAAAVTSMCSTKKNSGEAIESPYIAYIGTKPEVLFPQPWGALCYVLQRKEARGGKLADSSLPAIFLGTPLGVKGAIVQYASGKVDVSHDLDFPSGYTPGKGAIELGLATGDPQDEIAQAAEDAQRYSQEDADWTPSNDEADDRQGFQVRDLWLADNESAPLTLTDDFAHGVEELFTTDEEPSLAEDQERLEGQDPGDSRKQALASSLSDSRGHSGPPSFSYSDREETYVAPGSVTGTTSRGRATRKPGNYWEATAARSTHALDKDQCDGDLPLSEQSFSEMPKPALALPPSEPFEVHCRQSLEQSQSQTGADAEPVYYFRHSAGTMRDVQKCGQPERYEKALAVEMANIFDRGVVRLAVMPDGEKALDSFTFFRDKFSASGEYEKTKCRHVLRGDLQDWWQYNDTSAQTLQPRHFRTFIAICAAEMFEPFAMDFKSAFLQIPMKERMFLRLYKWMEPSLPVNVRQELADYRKLGYRNLGFEMLMTIYGCRQGPHNLNEAVSKDLAKFGLTQCVKAPCLWYRKGADGRPDLLVAVFADDVATAGQPDVREAFVGYMKKIYEVGSDEPMTSYIGYMVKRDPDTGNIHLSMPERIVQALDRFNLLQATSSATPMAVSSRPLQDYAPEADSDEARECAKLPYSQLIGVLSYLSQTVRPDIVVVVRMLASHSNNPGLYHWKSAKRVLRYLKGTRHLGICYRGGGDLLLSGNSDASHGGNCYDSRTFSGYFTMLAGGPINWDVHKQRAVPVSTADAEFTGLYHLALDAVGFRLLLAELGYDQTGPTNLQCDNTSAIQWAYGHGRVDKTKTLRLQLHKLQEYTSDKEISVSHLQSSLMPADMLTKVLPAATLQRLRAFVLA